MASSIRYCIGCARWYSNGTLRCIMAGLSAEWLLEGVVIIVAVGVYRHIASYPGLKFKAWYTLLAHALIKQRARNYSIWK